MKVRDYVAAFTFAGAVIAGSFAVAGQSQAAVVHRQPVCSTELAAYRVVSRQAGLRIGSGYTRVLSDASNHIWAAELRRAGDYPLARAAARISDDASDAPVRDGAHSIRCGGARAQRMQVENQHYSLTGRHQRSSRWQARVYYSTCSTAGVCTTGTVVHTERKYSQGEAMNTTAAVAFRNGRTARVIEMARNARNAENYYRADQLLAEADGLEAWSGVPCGTGSRAAISATIRGMRRAASA